MSHRTIPEGWVGIRTSSHRARQRVQRAVTNDGGEWFTVFHWLPNDRGAAHWMVIPERCARRALEVKGASLVKRHGEFFKAGWGNSPRLPDEFYSPEVNAMYHQAVTP